MQTWADLAIVFAWTLCVLGTVKMVFGSFWGDEVRSLLARRWRPDVKAIERLQYEVRKGVAWTPEGVNDPLVAKVPLAESVLRDRQQRLARMQTGTLPRRAVLYGLGCAACQSFWVALGLQLLTTGPRRLGWCVLSALMYASLAGAVGGAIVGRLPGTAKHGRPEGKCG